MTRWIVAALLVAFVAASYIWVPSPEDTAEAGVQTPPPPADARGPQAVDLRAERSDAVAPFAETWALSFPDRQAAALRLTLSIGPAAATGPIPGRLTAVGGDPAGFLARVREVLGVGDAPPAAPTPALDLQLVELGRDLSIDRGDVGATIIAGGFVASPAGDWRAYRVAFGEGGPQCFLGLSPASGQAMLLLRESADGPPILARLRGLLQSRPAAS